MREGIENLFIRSLKTDNKEKMEELLKQNPIAEPNIILPSALIEAIENDVLPDKFSDKLVMHPSKNKIDSPAIKIKKEQESIIPESIIRRHV